jgi:hypothetical protein
MNKTAKVTPAQESIDRTSVAMLAFAKKKLRLWGTLFFANLIAFAFLLKGMPAHALWPTIGPIVGILLMFNFAVAGYYSLFFFDWWKLGKK